MNFPLPSKSGSGDGPQRSGTPVQRVDQRPTFTEILLPNGMQGSQGVYGAQGPLGLVGFPGAGGLSGRQGIQGWQGWQGSQAEGMQGVDGLDGYAGFAGNQGSQGSQISGPPNSGSDPGPQGQQGDTNGPQGLQGAQAISITGSQGRQSNYGPQGFQGIQGPSLDGPTGKPGKYGSQGAQGIQETGLVGRQGLQGVQAPAPGTVGVQGYQGYIGYQGYKYLLGIQGWQGLQGQFVSPSGTLIYVEDFDGGVVDPTLSQSGTITLVNTSAFGIAKITTATSANSEAWVALGQFPQYPASEGLAQYATFTAYIAVYGTSMSGQKVVMGLVSTQEDPETGGCTFISSSIGSGNWMCVNKDYYGSALIVSDSYPVFSDGVTFTFQKLEIVRSATDVKYYIDDVLKATNTSNIVWQNLTPVLYIITSSGARSVFCDLLQFKVTR